MSRITVCIVILVLIAGTAWSQRMGSNVQYRPDQCLRGDKHRPEPETGDYYACHQWRDGACCSSDFTKQLANSSVISIDGFHWDRCDYNFSSQCRQFFVEIECFYRCSPNVAHFEVAEFPSAFANLPLCRDYCDRWYEACKDESTCAVNWITDWDYDSATGENNCKVNSTCQRYSDVYKNGRGICNNLWGRSFFYSNFSSTDPDDRRECLMPSFPVNGTNPNTVVIQRFFDQSGSMMLIGNINIVLIALIAVFTLMYF